MNTRSSIETELVGTSEYLLKPVYFELFMSAQGYNPKTILAKDNESEIRMLRNGKNPVHRTQDMSLSSIFGARIR